MKFFLLVLGIGVVIWLERQRRKHAAFNEPDLVERLRAAIQRDIPT